MKDYSSRRKVENIKDIYLFSNLPVDNLKGYKVVVRDGYYEEYINTVFNTTDRKKMAKIKKKDMMEGRELRLIGLIDDFKSEVSIVPLSSDLCSFSVETLELLSQIIDDLRLIMNDLSVGYSTKKKIKRLDENRISDIECEINDIWKENKFKVKNFEPTNISSAYLNRLRTKCRILELEVIDTYYSAGYRDCTSYEAYMNILIPIYFNRLSDLLYVMSREVEDYNYNGYSY